MNYITYHARRLFSFTGRENRQPFWIWVAICYGIQTALSMIAMIPFMVWMFSKMQMLMARGPDAAPPNPEAMFSDMQPMMVGMAFFGAIAGAVFVLLLASAIVRRLHDRNLSGWWGLPVLLFNVISQVSSVSMIASGKINLKPDRQHPFAAAAQGFGLLQFLALGSLLVLIVFLVLPGTMGPNRFGPDPLFEP